MRRRRHRRYEQTELRLDNRNRKICGVCAGIANYFGWSSFAVRLLSIVALCLMPHIIFPGYILAYLILDDENKELYEL